MCAIVQLNDRTFYNARISRKQTSEHQFDLRPEQSDACNKSDAFPEKSDSVTDTGIDNIENVKAITVLVATF